MTEPRIHQCLSDNCVVPTVIISIQRKIRKPRPSLLKVQESFYGMRILTLRTKKKKKTPVRKQNFLQRLFLQLLSAYFYINNIPPVSTSFFQTISTSLSFRLIISKTSVWLFLHFFQTVSTKPVWMFIHPFISNILYNFSLTVFIPVSFRFFLQVLTISTSTFVCLVLHQFYSDCCTTFVWLFLQVSFRLFLQLLFDCFYTSFC